MHAPPGAIDALKALGVNLVALSNNHSYDLGERGLLNTLEAVEQDGLAHAGIGRNLETARAPGYLETGKLKVGLVAMASGLIQPGGAAGPTRPGVNELRLVGGTPGLRAGSPDPEDRREILAAIRDAAASADLVIAYQHNHVYDRDFVKMMVGRMPERLVPPAWIQAWAHEEVEAGADVVVLHGTPLLQGLEIYHGRPIFYDLGNFIFQLPLHYEPPDLFEQDVWKSVVARVNFDGKRLRSITFTPVRIDPDGRGGGDLKVATRGLPRRAHGRAAREILQRLVDASRPFGAAIRVKGDVAELQVARGGG